MSARGTCDSCGAPIWWVQTAKRKRMPLDAEPRADGNVRVAGRLSNGTVVVAVLKKGEGTHVAHFVTCPEAEKHRRKK